MRNLGNKFLFWLGIGVLTSGGAHAQAADDFISRCGAYERDSARAAHDAQWRKMREASERSIADFKRNRSSKNARLFADDEVITIPVVVHVVSQNSADFTESSSNVNISDEQVYSQIKVLNDDYRRTSEMRGFGEDDRGVDTRIQFVLAEYDIHGRPVGTFNTETKRFSGINRIQTTKESFRICNTCTTEDELSDLTINDFPPTHYLNIWVCKLTGGYLGVAQFPIDSHVEGLETRGLYEKNDGVIIDYRYFGSEHISNTNQLYKYGRTTTHEVGHWLGLRHIWGDTRCGDDYVDDTPWADSKNENSCRDVYTTCVPPEEPFTLKMIENFMDYTPDACMHIFTKGQMERMRTVLETAPLRQKLVLNSKLSPVSDTPSLEVTMFPNPVKEWMQVAVSFVGEKNIALSIYNVEGNVVYNQEYPRSRSRYIPLLAEDLPKGKGVYVLKVDTGSEVMTKRFIKD